MGAQTPGVIRFFGRQLCKEKVECVLIKKKYGLKTMRVYDIYLQIFKYYLTYFSR